jgi:hypothetical protein
MKLTNKVTNIFFAVFAVIGLFMPIIGYKTALTGAEYNIVDMVNMLKGMNSSSGTSLLKNLQPYGYKGAAIATAVFFVLMLLMLLISLIISFFNVPYLALMITTGLGFASYVTAVSTFTAIGGAFVAGTIPLSAITSLSSGSSTNVLTSLLSSFANITQMGITSGAYVGVICLGIMFIVNLVYFIFRKKIKLMDNSEGEINSKKDKQVKNKNEKSKKKTK